ncbi:MAG: response regulator [Candidatus Pacebacteria bacterium]|jgi:two-component system alkaline phosphatase synthesis response regulator PhoP|nr:response regulator [Parcubacteria group bacterium]MDP6249443.1 response regulator [Candidatus Paceibacterota bacterium]MDP7366294.1 response regulator [Candidatus Paceibacterota bacterium]MDP7466183.1 response regulator [Candidatus Paceibacterota bacterium]HJO89858.1 response regulator [Candidatus Paceibacterota bacterium]|tara:strand:- start:2810 stop:3208 length:399 start_codon:yes stop_codon:yes gene_type:complete
MEQKAKNKKKIFIIDDDNFLLEMYVTKFKEGGFEVVASLDTKEALNRLREGLVPDIILFDIVMPDMDGFEFLKVVDEENLVKDCIKIALTNQWQESNIKKAKELGVSDYIVKANFIPSEVLNNVQKIIDKKK